MKYSLVPTENQTYRIVGGEGDTSLPQRLERARALQAEGKIEEAFAERFEAFREIAEILPEDDYIDLDANHAPTLAAMEIIRESAIDAYLIGEPELAAGQLELLLDCDGEDHLEVTPSLALCYLALQDWECLEGIDMDLDPKSPFKALLNVWRTYCMGGEADAKELDALRAHKALAAELKAGEHPTDEAFLADISSERPSQEALARELWLRAQPALEHSKTDLAEYLKRVL